MTKVYSNRKALFGINLIVIMAFMLSLVGVAALPPQTALAVPGPKVESFLQWANTDLNWVSGNLGASKALYYEGDSVPYYAYLDNLTMGNVYSLTIQWDTTKAGKHALDYLTTYDRSWTPADPCTEEGLAACGVIDIESIPADTTMQGDTNWGGTQVPGVFTIFQGTFVDPGGNPGGVATSAYTLVGPYTGDSSTSITVYFQADDAEIVLTWGGHIASRHDWGIGNSAVDISGSPYHMRLIDFAQVLPTDQLSVGQMDLSLSAEAVVFPAFITIVKEATPEGSTVFNFTGDLGAFPLVDDGTISNTIVFSPIIDFMVYNVTELVPLGWNLDSIVCSDGSLVDVPTATASIDLVEGEDVTCTFYNIQVEPPTCHITAFPDVTVCDGVTVTLTEDGGDADSWLWSTTETTQSIDVTVSGNYWVDATSSTSGQTTRCDIDVTVNDSPTVILSGDASFCDDSSTLITATPSGGAAPYSYDWSASTAAGTANNGTFTATGTGTVEVTVTDDNDCTGSDSMAVTEYTSPTVTLSGDDSFCDDSSTLITATPSGGAAPYSYDWSASTAAGTANNGTFTATGTGTVEVTVTDDNDCTGSDSMAVTEYTSPTVTLSGDDSFCDDSSTLITATPSGGAAPYSYDWSASTAAGTANNGTFTATGTGTVEVTVTDDNDCTGSDSMAVTEYTSPTVTLSGDDSFCDDSSTLITATPSGGAAPYSYDWSASTAAGTANNGTFTATGTGTVEVTVTDDNDCTGSDSMAVTEYTSPTVTLSGDASFCDDSSTLITATPSGGAAPYSYDWSASTAAGTANNGTFTATGTGTVEVTVTDDNDCTGSDSMAVTEYTSPTVILSGDASFCDDSSTLITATPSGGAAPYSYDWSASTAAGTANNGTFTATGTGTVEVTVTDDNDCTGSDSMAVTEYTSPTVTLSGDDSFCDDSSTLITATPSGGAAPYSYDWSASTAAGTANNGTFTATGTGTVEVTVTDDNDCTGSDSMAVTEYTSPTVTLSGDDSFCDDSSTLITATPSGGAAPYSYDWSASTAAGTANNGTFTATGTGTVEVTVTDDNDCTGSDSMAVTEYTSPTVTLSGDDSFCDDSSTLITATPSGGAAPYSYDWSASTAAGTANNGTFTATGTGTVEVTVTDDNDCTGSDSMAVTEYTSPTVTLSGDDSFCDDSSTLITATPSGGAAPYSYDWSASTAAGTANNGTFTATGTGTVEVTVTDDNDCTGSDSMAVTEYTSPTVTLSGDDSFCDDSSTLITATPSGGAAPYSYDWSASTAAGTANNGTFTATGTGTVEVTVTDDNDCTGSDSMAVTEYTSPTVTLSGDDSFCDDSSTLITATPSGGAAPYSYDWSASTAAGTANNGTFTATGTGTVEVTVTDDNDCTGSDSMAVTEYTSPTVTLSGDDSFCDDSSTLITATPSGGAAPYSYDWSASTAAGTANNGTFTATGTGTVEVTVTDDNDCTGSDSMAVTEYTSPTVTLSGDDSFCDDSSTLITATPSGGAAPYSYDWSASTAAGTANNGTFTATGTGTVEVTVTDDNDCTGSDSMAVTEYTSPTVTLSGDDSFCDDSSTLITATPSGGAAPYSYDWSASTAAGTANNGTFTATGTGTVEVTVTDDNDCTGSDSMAVTEYTSPTVTLSGDDSFCDDSSTLITATPSGGAAPYSYDWSASTAAGTANNGTFTATGTGTVEVTVTDDNDCTGSDSMAVTEYTSPTVILSGDDSFCDDSSTLITATPSGGAAPYSYDWSASTAAGTANNGTFTATGTGTVEVTVTDDNDCTGSDSMAVTANPGPDCTITAPSPVLPGSINTASVQYAGPGSSYDWTVSGAGTLLSQSDNVITWQAGDEEGTVNISVTVTDANDCQNSCDADVLVRTIPPPPPPCEPEIQLAVLLDGSSSMSEEEWQTEIQGLYEAVRDPNCMPDCYVELTVIQFAGDIGARREIGPVVIDSDNRLDIAERVLVIEKSAGWTPIEAGIYEAIDRIFNSRYFHPALKQIINISSDIGAQTLHWDDIIEARNVAVDPDTGIIDVISAEGIGDIRSVDMIWLRDNILYPEPGHVAPCSWTPGWVYYVGVGENAIPDFKAAICEKVQPGWNELDEWWVLEVVEDSASIEAGYSYPFSAWATYCDNDVRDVTALAGWASSDTTVATVAAGLAAGLAEGDTIITATYLGRSAVATLEVTEEGAPVTPTVVSVTPVEATIEVGESQQFTAEATYPDASVKDVTALAGWASSDTDVATVAAGLAAGLAEGDTIITATYLGRSAVATLEVTEEGAPVTPTVVAIEVTPEEAAIEEGENQQFTAEAIYTDASVVDVTALATWASSDTDVATVATGLADGVAEGDVVITATFEGLSDTADLDVTAVEPEPTPQPFPPFYILPTPTPPIPVVVESVEVAPVETAIEVGESQQFTAEATYSDDSVDDVTALADWASSNTTVATVAAGLADGVAEGDVVITATFDGMSDTADLEVTGPLAVESIVLSPEGDTVEPGDTIQFTAQATLSDGSTADVSGEAAWESSNSGVATVFAGLVIGVEEGTAEITATFGGVTGGPVTVTVIGVPPVVESIELTFESDSIGAGDTVQFTATATYPDGTTVAITGEVSWSSSDPDVATIVAGLATGESEGTAVITASVDGVQSDPITLTITAPAALQWWVILVIVLGLLAIGLILFLLLRRGGGEQPAEAA